MGSWRPSGGHECGLQYGGNARAGDAEKKDMKDAEAEAVDMEDLKPEDTDVNDTEDAKDVYDEDKVEDAKAKDTEAEDAEVKETEDTKESSMVFFVTLLQTLSHSPYINKSINFPAFIF